MEVSAQSDKVFMVINAKEDQEEQMKQGLDFVQASYPDLCASENKVHFSVQVAKTFQDLLIAEKPFLAAFEGFNFSFNIDT